MIHPLDLTRDGMDYWVGEWGGTLTSASTSARLGGAASLSSVVSRSSNSKEVINRTVCT